MASIEAHSFQGEQTMQAQATAASFRKGDRVHVLNCSMGGTFFIEGEATVLKVIDARMNQYLVDFGDNMPVERFVDAGAQADPAKHVAWLNDPHGDDAA